MRSAEERQAVQELLQLGLNDCEISRRTGVHRRTVLDWRHGRGSIIPRPRTVDDDQRARLSTTGCGVSELGPAYAYVLGVYLGDGHVVRHAHGTYRLRIFCSADHPGILLKISAALEVLFPRKRTNWYLHPTAAMVILAMCSNEWPTLLPQHGPGVKHRREIKLTDWQQAVVIEHPEALIKGLIHSDGCRSLNVIKHPKRTYAYPRYQFSNRSMDIHRIFTDACDRIGVEWRWMNQWNVSVAKRASVARLDEFIGPKR